MFINIIKVIYYILLCLSLMYGLYFSISGIAGLFKKNKLKNVKNNKKNFFAIVIPARNEEEVIGNLIDSLMKLNYPKDRYGIFVIPNNCTDNTSKVALSRGASVFECKSKVKSKGDVLKYAFNKLKDNKEIDAYVVFDADNVVHKDFLKEMNIVLNSGYEVAQGFRDSKNPSDNWISGSYTIFYLFQNVFFNKARMGFNASSSINGTGFMISKALVDRDGFETFTLTEDVEFTGQCALKDVKIAFADKAITYDEYPINFKSSCKQRKRWSAGIIECMKMYSPKLFLKFFKTGRLSCLDMALVYFGPLFQVLSFVIILMLMFFRLFGIQLTDIFSYLFAYNVLFFLITLVIGIALEVFVLLYNKKRVKELISGIVMFSIFLFSWVPINIDCLIRKYDRWEEIKHTRNININEIR